MADPKTTARAVLHDAAQDYACLVSEGPRILTDWTLVGEVVTDNDQRELILLTSEQCTAWNLIGMLLGGFRIAQDTLAG